MGSREKSVADRSAQRRSTPQSTATVFPHKKARPRHAQGIGVCLPALVRSGSGCRFHRISAVVAKCEGCYSNETQEVRYERLTPSALLHASGMYWESCAIHAAVHLDVFTPLSGGPMTVTELADRTGCVPQSLDRLLTALCAMGLLIRQGETCELPPFSRDHLCRGNPGYLGHIVEHHRHLMPGWSKLDESVRENRPTRHRSSVDTEDTGERESFLMGMYNIANAQAERSVPHIDLSGRSHLLDLGGATGAYAIHFCRRNPGLSATVFDLPTTRPFAERVIADSGMADRISFAGGDFTTEDLPGGFDVAWLSQILHGAGFDESANIVRKAAQSLVPGGLLLIQEFILDDNRSGPQHPALFDLNMLVGTPDGQSYTRQELAGFMRNAGLEDIRRLPLDLPQGCGIMAGTVPVGM